VESLVGAQSHGRAYLLVVDSPGQRPIGGDLLVVCFQHTQPVAEFVGQRVVGVFGRRWFAGAVEVSLSEVSDERA